MCEKQDTEQIEEKRKRLEYLKSVYRLEKSINEVMRREIKRLETELSGDTSKG